MDRESEDIQNWDMFDQFLSISFAFCQVRGR